MFFRRPVEGPLILLLVKRLALFSFILCLFSLFLYGLGTRQEFTDPTQLLLLRLTRGLGLFLAAVSLYGMAADLVMVLRRRKLHYWYGLGGYGFLLVFGAAAAAFAAFVSTAAGGNTP